MNWFEGESSIVGLIIVGIIAAVVGSIMKRPAQSLTLLGGAVMVGGVFSVALLPVAGLVIPVMMLLVGLVLVGLGRMADLMQRQLDETIRLRTAIELTPVSRGQMPPVTAHDDTRIRPPLR